MKIVLVAGDFAQSEVLRMLEIRLAEAGNKVSSFLCYGRVGQFSTETIVEAIKGAEWLVSGMSELFFEETIAVREAVNRNIRIALYADTFDAYRSPVFEFVRISSVTLFVVNNDEAVGARQIFPKANVLITGNPRWEEFAFPRLSRQKAREILGIVGNRRVILCPGDKYLAQNMIQFSATIDAVQRLGWEGDAEILFALHPGEPNTPKLYDELLVRSGCLSHIIGRHVGINTGDILVGCDLVVEFTSTIGIQAACLRIPVIDYCSTIALRGHKPVAGKDPWVLAQRGATIPVFPSLGDDLALTINKIENGKLGLRLRSDQEKMFPITAADDRGQAIRRMYEALQG